MPRLNSSEKRLFIICLILAGTGFFIRIAANPLKEMFTNPDKKIVESRKRLRKNLRTIRENNMVLARYNAYVKDFGQKMTDEQEMSAMISELEGVAEETDILFSEIKSRRVNKVDFYKVFSVSLKMNGNLEQIVHLLYLLQSKPHLFRVDELRLNKQSRRTSLLKARLILSRTVINNR